MSTCSRSRSARAPSRRFSGAARRRSSSPPARPAAAARFARLGVDRRHLLLALAQHAPGAGSGCWWRAASLSSTASSFAVGLLGRGQPLAGVAGQLGPSSSRDLLLEPGLGLLQRRHRRGPVDRAPPADRRPAATSTADDDQALRGQPDDTPACGGGLVLCVLPWMPSSSPCLVHRGLGRVAGTTFAAPPISGVVDYSATAENAFGRVRRSGGRATADRSEPDRPRVEPPRQPPMPRPARRAGERPRRGPRRRAREAAAAERRRRALPAPGAVHRHRARRLPRLRPDLLPPDASSGPTASTSTCSSGWPRTWLEFCLDDRRVEACRVIIRKPEVYPGSATPEISVYRIRAD